jgi:hypothetical protein
VEPAGRAVAESDPATPKQSAVAQPLVPESPPAAPLPEGTCLDLDGDLHGQGCVAGPDCDDANATLTGECTRCIRPDEGCECAPEAAPVPCGAPEAGVCSAGIRVCDGGRWSECLRTSVAPLIATGISQCPGICDPTCRLIVDCPTAGDSMPADSTGVEFGTQPAAAFCPAGSPAGGITPSCESAPGGPYLRSISLALWVDACAAPGSQRVLVGSDEGVTQLPLPFTFSFYGVPYTSVRVSANGYLSFSDAAPQWVNSMLPTSTVPNSIFAFWDDLVMRDGVCLATYGASPDRLFVAEWSNADLEDRGGAGNAGARLSFEVVLEEASQAVSVIYGTMEGDARATGSGATIGVQSADRVRFDQVGSDQANVVAAGTSFRWSPPISGICDGSGSCSACTVSEVCDGLDNNCNALIDDAVTDIPCGVGACRRTVVGCLRGAVPACVPGTPTTELCNTVDDDCDGMVDEGCNGSLACPADVSMLAGNTVALTAATLGTVSDMTWTVVSGPSGGATSAIWNPAPPTSLNEAFRPIIVGAYRIRVAARDGFNAPLSCEFNVTAQGHGIRVELTWDGNGDLDLHMHNGNMTRWFNATPDDCHYARMSTSWGAVLDVDNVTRNGPENIRVDTPTIGQDYIVGVHHYANGVGRRATIKVYCGGGTTPVSTFASAAMTGTQTGNCTNNSFWRVARVTADAGGGCTVAPIATVTTSTHACNNF